MGIYDNNYDKGWLNLILSHVILLIIGIIMYNITYMIGLITRYMDRQSLVVMRKRQTHSVTG